MTISTGIFVLALLLLGGFFALKQWEVARGRIVAPVFRGKVDERAVRFQKGANRWILIFEHLPLFVVYLMRQVVHIGAKWFARLARIAERRAHRVADFVSHKRGFERKETKSDFLKQVTEYKNGLPSERQALDIEG